MNTKHVNLVGKKKFVALALDPEHETFIVHITSFSSTLLNVDIYLFYRPQIVNLIAKKVFTKVFIKYTNFANIFSSNLASKLLKHIEINNHAIELVIGQQLPYGPIYSLRPVELETLKAYIEINLASRFIRLSRLLASFFIHFN